MSSTTIGTVKAFMQRLYATNSTAASITAPAATITDPLGNAGVFQLPVVSGIQQNQSLFPASSGPNQLSLIFFGVGSATTGLARITAWFPTASSTNTLWIPVPLLALTLTLGSGTGVAGSNILDTDKIAASIVVSTAFTSAYEVISPADNTVACVKLDHFGASRIQVQTGLNSSSTSLNCLYGMF